MIKRISKVTSLLVAAASMMSLVPAMAADTTRLGTKEGTIETAVAFKDGKYVYEGYKTSSDDKSIYFNAGDKDKDLTEITDADLEGVYADKYAFAKDGSDEYLVDLTDGKVIDESTPEDKIDNAASKLKSIIKKTDRYGDAITVASSQLDALEGAKFAETWYSYSVAPTNGKATGTVYGYTNEAGKYIDVSNIANVYAYSSTKGKVVKISEFSDADTDTKLQADLVGAPEFLAQDKDNIYQKVTVKITDSNAVGTQALTTAKAVVNFPTSESDTAIVGKKAVLTVNWNNVNTSANVQIAGTSYTATTASAVTGTDFNNLDTLKAAVKATLTGYTYSEANGIGTFTNTAIGTFADPTTGDTNAVTKYTDGKLDTFTVAGVVFQHNGSTVGQSYTDVASLKKAVNDYFTGVNIQSQGTTTFNYSNGVFTAVNSGVTGVTLFNADGADVTFVDGKAANSNTGTKTWTTTYIQKISKAQGETKDDAYLPKTVEAYELSKNFYDSGDGDDAFNDVADANGYTVINGTLYAINDDGSNVTVSALNLKKDKVKFDASSLPTGFTADSKVDVYLVEEGNEDDVDTTDVSVDVNGNVWAIKDGKIYKFDGTEFKVQYTCDTGIDQLDVYDGNSLIAWDASGDIYTTVGEGTKVTQGETPVVTPVIKTGWQQDGANWFYNDATGAKLTSKWFNDRGTWYYLKADGVMATGWFNDNGTWYYLASSGAMKTGWINDNGTWYYLASSGAMKTGWVQDGANWYYLNGSGAMLANTTVGGYKLGANGAWIG